MLRRDFIKSSAFIAGGILFLPQIPHASEPEENSPLHSRKKALNFHGHPRSGCASRPELAPMLEKGFAGMPPF